MAAPAFAAVDEVQLRIRTFVHQADYIGNPLTCQGAITINGDNRGTQATGGSSRTTYSFTRQFKKLDGSASNIRTIDKSAGSTTGNVPFLGTVTVPGSTTGMTYSTVSSGATSTTWQVSHAVANPLCSDALPMDYSLSVTVTSAKKVTLSGSADSFPDIEVYAKKTGGAWVKIYNAEGNNLLCLSSNLPGCAKRTISVINKAI